MRWNGASYFEFVGKPMETETTWLEFPDWGNAFVEQILTSEEEQGCESHSNGSEQES